MGHECAGSDTKIDIVNHSISKRVSHRVASTNTAYGGRVEKEQTFKQKLLSLKRSLMEDLLTGKVRVNYMISRTTNP